MRHKIKHSVLAKHVEDMKQTETPGIKKKDLQFPDKRKVSVEKLEAKKLKQHTIEEQPSFVEIKLKKVGIVKRTWEDEKLETIELKSHKFELLPEKECLDMCVGLVFLSEPLIEIDKSEETQESALQKRKKKIKKLLAKEKSTKQLEKTDKSNLEVKEVDVQQPDFREVQLKQAKRIPKPLEMEIEPQFLKTKLNKSETIKRQWEDMKLEETHLKHHEFELAPETEMARNNCKL